jgi:hypothetical protein
LQNFSNLRATRTVTPGRIVSVTEKEISAIVAESAALTKQAAARTEVARAGIEEARRKQEEAIARHEALLPEFRAMVRDSGRKTDAIIAELKEHRDERRALLEAIFKVMDRLD